VAQSATPTLDFNAFGGMAFRERMYNFNQINSLGGADEVCSSSISFTSLFDQKEIFMKGNDKVIAVLNGFLADELTAINQYIVHSEMCDNWGYHKLHDLVEKRAIKEMEHAEKLIARILFLEGKPIVSELKKINIGSTVDAQFKNDIAAELEAIQGYNEGIKVCLEVGDGGSRELIEDNLEDEEEHLDWLEAQMDQISQMGLQNYLTNQVG
jgi:bacterioferritin